MNEKHVLVVFPHPDDESFGPAGTIAKYTNSGVPVTYACLTLGEMGRNMGKSQFANRESLPQLRKQELFEACAILGIKDLRMLGFRDKTIEFEDEVEVTSKIKEIIDEVKPSLIITHYPGYGVHPDHDATAKATVAAVQQLSPDERPKLYCMAISNNREQMLGKPEIIFQIEDVLNTKIAAIKAHRSQTEAMFKEGVNKNAIVKKWLQEEHFWIYNFENEKKSLNYQ